jgi:hypothetical protein
VFSSVLPAHFRKSALVFDLKDADYTRVVVDVDDPNKILAELAAGAAEPSAGAKASSPRRSG